MMVSELRLFHRWATLVLKLRFLKPDACCICTFIWWPLFLSASVGGNIFCQDIQSSSSSGRCLLYNVFNVITLFFVNTALWYGHTKLCTVKLFFTLTQDNFLRLYSELEGNQGSLIFWVCDRHTGHTRFCKTLRCIWVILEKVALFNFYNVFVNTTLWYSHTNLCTVKLFFTLTQDHFLRLSGNQGSLIFWVCDRHLSFMGGALYFSKLSMWLVMFCK